MPLLSVHVQSVELRLSAGSFVILTQDTRNISPITSDGPHLKTHTYTKRWIYKRNNIQIKIPGY